MSVFGVPPSRKVFGPRVCLLGAVVCIRFASMFVIHPRCCACVVAFARVVRSGTVLSRASEKIPRVDRGRICPEVAMLRSRWVVKTVKFVFVPPRSHFVPAVSFLLFSLVLPRTMSAIASPSTTDKAAEPLLAVVTRMNDLRRPREGQMMGFNTHARLVDVIRRFAGLLVCSSSFRFARSLLMPLSVRRSALRSPATFTPRSSSFAALWGLGSPSRKLSD